MSQNKYNILIILPKREPGGVEYHRLIVPFLALARLYPEFTITHTDQFETGTDEELKDIDLVVFNRLLPGNAKESLLRLKKLNIVSVIDLDDYWHLSFNHGLKDWFKLHNISQRITECIRLCDHATVTHEYLGSMLTKASGKQKSFTVIPNAIDPVIDQFNIIEKPIGRNVEFGWVGGSQHMEDIRLMESSIKELHASNLNFTLTLGGDSPDPAYVYYTKILSANMTSRPDRFFKIGAEPVNRYAMMYDQFDVSLIPLNDNIFNNCKSNLKILEAGFKKKSIICSNIHPYTSILKHNKNGLGVNPGDNKNGWHKAIKRYCKNKQMILDHAEQLHADVQPYHIDLITKIRADLFRQLIDNKNKV